MTLFKKAFSVFSSLPASFPPRFLTITTTTYDYIFSFFVTKKSNILSDAGHQKVTFLDFYKSYRENIQFHSQVRTIVQQFLPADFSSSPRPAKSSSWRISWVGEHQVEAKEYAWRNATNLAFKAACVVCTVHATGFFSLSLCFSLPRIPHTHTLTVEIST